VKNGYGRNYLIPQGMALINNDTNARRLADYRAREERAESKKLGVYQAIADQLKGKTLKIGAKAGTSGKIFGSVTNEVKNLGTYTLNLKLHKEVIAPVEFEVVAE